MRKSYNVLDNFNACYLRLNFQRYRVEENNLTQIIFMSLSITINVLPYYAIHCHKKLMVIITTKFILYNHFNFKSYILFFSASNKMSVRSQYNDSRRKYSAYDVH